MLSECVCARVHACVWCMYICTPAHMHMCTQMYRDQRLTCMPYLLLTTLFLRQCLSLNLKFINSVGLATEFQTFLSSSSVNIKDVSSFCMATRGSKSGPHAYTADPLHMEPSPKLPVSVFPQIPYCSFLLILEIRSHDCLGFVTPTQYDYSESFNILHKLNNYLVKIYITFY